jgi:hypothetical protein
MMNYLYITFGITGQLVWPTAGHIVEISRWGRIHRLDFQICAFLGFILDPV